MKKKTVWTKFCDMYSGGGQKEKFAYCYIEAPIEEAKVIFYNRFGHNPERVTCTCCGRDYSISESDTLWEATGYHRGARYDRTGNKILKNTDIPLEEYLEEQGENTLVIYAKDIKNEERSGDVPSQGYVWVD